MALPFQYLSTFTLLLHEDNAQEAAATSLLGLSAPHLRLHDAFRGSQDLLNICQITHPARFDKPRKSFMLGMTERASLVLLQVPEASAAPRTASRSAPSGVCLYAFLIEEGICQ